jgi:ABC-type lipoprotein export system ATPase subunit
MSDARPLALHIRDVRKSFMVGGEPLHILRGVDLDVPAGQFVGVMGPSGSGKSTLLYLIGGLDRQTSGAITVAGEQIDAMTSAQLAQFRRRQIGFVFQSFHLVPTLTALENVALPGIFANMPDAAAHARAMKLLGILKMDARADHRPSQLSGGQQQRIAIARALFNEPSIIMADEPTGALDSQTAEIVMRLLRALCTRTGKTVIVVTHDPGIEQYADRMVSLRDGVIVNDVVLRKGEP